MFFDKIENFNTKKIYLISLFVCIGYALVDIVALILDFRLASLLRFLVYTAIDISILVFIKKEKFDWAFLFVLLSSLVGIVEAFLNFNTNSEAIISLIVSVFTLIIYTLYFVKGLKDYRALYLIVGITLFRVFSSIVGNIYYIFNAGEFFYNGIIAIFSNICTILSIIRVLSLVNKQYKSDNADLFKSAIKIVGILVAVLVVIVFCRSCFAGASGETCQYIDEDGNKVCSRPATKGSLCSYHYNMLNDYYEDLEDWWNSLK